MARHLTARGEPIDMAALVTANATAPALGNARMNARGDILGENGIVLKTQEQIEAEWAAEKAKQKQTAGKPANLKAPLENMVDPTAPQPQKNLTADKDFEPMVSPQQESQSSPRRRIVETE